MVPRRSRPPLSVFVVLRWGEAALWARSIGRGQRLVLGSGRGAWPLPAEWLPTPSHTLVDHTLPTPAPPRVCLPSAEPRELTPGEDVCWEVGPIRVDVCCSVQDPATNRRLRSRLDRRFAAWWLAAALGHAAVLVALAAAVPRLGMVPELPVDRDELRLVQAGVLGLGEPEFEEPAPTDMLGMYPSPVHLPDGARCGDREDLGGSELLARGRYGIGGPKDNPDPHLSRYREVGSSVQQGEPARVRRSPTAPLDVPSADPDALVAVWGREDSLGTDRHSVRGAMWGDRLDTSPGGDSGKIDVEGGKVKGIEVARHAPTGNSGPPRVVHFQIDVAGGREPGAVEREMATHLVALRGCYRANPESQGDHEGRVDLAFRIGADGVSGDVRAVRTHGVAPAVVACMTNVIDDATFPSGPSTTDVTYPLVLMPGRSDETAVASRPVAPPIVHEPWRSPCGDGRRPAAPVAPCSR